MARRAQPVSAWPGQVAAALVAAFVLATLIAVFVRADASTQLESADWVAVRFTILQALLSAFVSVGLAIPVARALARRAFPGRNALVLLLGAPFLLPTIVAVLGLLTVFGRAGWVSSVLTWYGLEPIHIYGLHGVVLAHVFFNLPLATRLLLQGWADIPAEHFRLAAHLGAGRVGVFRLIEAPMLLRIAPGAFAVIFALCLTSFAVALTLGGGPRATTIELAIYQAFRYDFDLSKAAYLGLIQIAVTLCAGMIALRFGLRDAGARGLDRRLAAIPMPAGRWAVDVLWIGGATLFLCAPLAAVILRGVAALPGLPVVVVQSSAVSITVALASTAMAMGLAVVMAVSAAVARPRLVEVAGLLGLAVSPLVIGTGLFLLLRPFVNPGSVALAVTAAVNAVLALPFCLRILAPRVRESVADFGRLGLTLDMQGWPFCRWVLWPRLRPQVGFAAGLAAALSMGDLGVIALFAGADVPTLPLQVFRLMGAYRMDAAAGAALLLFALSLTLFWLFDQSGRRHASS